MALKSFSFRNHLSNSGVFSIKNINAVSTWIQNYIIFLNLVLNFGVFGKVGIMHYNISCLSSGVGRHGQLQIGTCHWKIRRIFQVGENKPLLIHTVPVAQVRQKKSVFDLADRDLDRIFSYAGQKILSRKAVRPIPT